MREVALDDAGMRVDLLRKTDASIAYVMPSHQFPLGIVMPMKRRLELLNWAVEEPERYIIEDDYDSEFRYKGKPIPALQGIDRSGRVIYLGTFSKSIASSIRVSYMVLPEHLLERYQECCGFYACTVPNLMQQAICQFMQEGYFEKNLNRMRAIYKSKHDFYAGRIKKVFLGAGNYGRKFRTASSGRSGYRLLRAGCDRSMCRTTDPGIWSVRILHQSESKT